MEALALLFGIREIERGTRHDMIHVNVLPVHSFGKLRLDIFAALICANPQEFLRGRRLVFAFERKSHATAQFVQQLETGIGVVAFVMVFALVCHVFFVCFAWFTLDPEFFAPATLAYPLVAFGAIGFLPGSFSLLLAYLAVGLNIRFYPRFRVLLACVKFTGTFK